MFLVHKDVVVYDVESCCYYDIQRSFRSQNDDVQIDEGIDEGVVKI